MNLLAHISPDFVWGGYPRISDDPNDERGGVMRQREDIVDTANRLGGTLDEEHMFEENNTSAFKKKKVPVKDPMGNEYMGYRVIRPRWHEALQALRTKRINGLIVWDLDRLARDPRDLEDAIEAVEYYGATIISATASDIDLTTEGGRMQARLFVLMANKASADTARRVKRAHLAKARSGEPVGSYRPFGYEADRMTVREEEAEALRSATAALIEGESLASVAKGLNAAGVLTSRGNPWNSVALRQVIRSPRYAGWRTHNRKIAVDKEGQPVRGAWEAILDQDTYDRVQAIFDKVDPRTRKPRRERHYLLTGLVRCGVCNAVMYGNRQPQGRFVYTCNAQRVKSHGMAGSGSEIDRLVTKYVRMRMDLAAQDHKIATAPARWSGAARLEEVGVEITDLMTQLRDGTRPPGDVYRDVAVLEDERAELTKSRTEWLETATGPTLAVYSDLQWEALSVDRKRAQIEQVLEAVVVMPATRRGSRFDPERLRFAPVQQLAGAPA